MKLHLFSQKLNPGLYATSTIAWTHTRLLTLWTFSKYRVFETIDANFVKNFFYINWSLQPQWFYSLSFLLFIIPGVFCMFHRVKQQRKGCDIVTFSGFFLLLTLILGLVELVEFAFVCLNLLLWYSALLCCMFI